jgi:hypothetical protein
MENNAIFTSWGLALIAGVSIMGTGVAFLRHPEQKAFVLMLPVPFTLAILALGRPVDATNVLAIVPSFGFTFGVWVLHGYLRWPIMAAIAICAVGYCVIGAGIFQSLPVGEGVFWGAVIGIAVLSWILIRWLPARDEPHHRTSLPIWIKLPAIVMVVIGLLAIRQYLGGFMTMFPMVGVIAAYEARNSLWALVHRFPRIALMMAIMMALIHLTQNHIGLPGALILALSLYFVTLWILRKSFLPLSKEA